MPRSYGGPADGRRDFLAGLRSGAGALLAAAAAVLIMMITATPAAAAVPSCDVGAYVTDLYGVDPVEGTVNADLWLWSVCPRKDLAAVPRLEFTNATKTMLTAPSSEKVGNEYWTQVKVSGTFRQTLDLTNFPFDKQVVRIQVEENRLDKSRFVYRADAKNSTYNPRIHPADFKITKFRIGVGDAPYRTNFGDPRLKQGGSSHYSQLVIEFQLTREDITSFGKQILPVYVALLVALISFLIWSKDNEVAMVARLGILGTALFTIMLNLRAVDEALGTFLNVTLVEEIHFMSLLYVLVGVANTTYLMKLLTDPMARPAARRFNNHVFAVTTGLYLLANIVVISLTVSF
ncbi:hypothetical protein [Streptomyces sp. NBC_00859]|uniref:hypothetical protein n=1 Tax=Streptomyces sp. NBC_00859 TaxID=2903682 RepID=UPI00386C0DC0|nr:hypothetical protein OG584_06770 [Streptomyces sp. NBC_00859]